MVPRRLGGYETDIHTYIAVMAEIGRGCGSSAWTASLLNVCAWLAGLFPERAQLDVWGANPEAWIAGSLAEKRVPSTAVGSLMDAGLGPPAVCTRNGLHAAFT